MRSALGISLAFHLLLSVIAFQWVSFREVRYVPRPVYNVTLVTTTAQAEPVRQEAPVTPEPEPEEEMPPPPEKPKPRPKDKKPENKTVPTTELEKTRPKPEAEPPETEQTPETGAVSFDTDDFPFAPYVNRMRRKIAANWRVPEGSQGADRSCRVYFRVHRDGAVSDVAVEESSGLFMFDQAAQRAVLQAAPMPPLPREYADAYLGVHFSFAYREKR
jgi:protein TonB